MDQSAARVCEHQPKFALGQVVATPAALNHLLPDDILVALGRHVRGDWGTLEAEDRRENERALTEGCRLLSAYQSRHNIKFWIITEADRSVTTVLLPEDY